jgi:hypothetical protein
VHIWHAGKLDWMETPAAADHIVRPWRFLTPIITWLGEHLPGAR